jgi:large subunit ribosomal protein L3
MSVGLVGKKAGMTQIFAEDGTHIPVTVLEVTPNRVTQIKEIDTDGYCAVQVTAGHKKASHVSKPMMGHFAKAGVEAGTKVCEFRIADANELTNFKLGDEIPVSLFSEGQYVDVRSVSKGKGFAGAVKRHHFRTQDATHGNSVSHRAPGSIGQRQTPGRVMKGKRMAGHLGNVCCTVQNQKIVKIDTERNLILVRGAVPGAPGAEVLIMKSIKRRGE